jgi:hypothetical protein
MAGKLGMGLLETLLENLDRDLNLASTTLTNPKIVTTAVVDLTTCASSTGVAAPGITAKTQMANAFAAPLVKNTWYLSPADGNNITATLPTNANSVKGDTIVVEYHVVISNGQTHKYGTTTQMFMVGSSVYKRAAVEIFSVDISDGTDDFLNLVGLTNAGPGIGTLVKFTFNGTNWMAEARCTSSGNGSVANLSVFATS